MTVDVQSIAYTCTCTCICLHVVGRLYKNAQHFEIRFLHCAVQPMEIYLLFSCSYFAGVRIVELHKQSRVFATTIAQRTYLYRYMYVHVCICTRRSCTKLYQTILPTVIVIHDRIASTARRPTSRSPRA